MELVKVISELRYELQLVEHMIQVLEDLANVKAKHQSRWREEMPKVQTAAAALPGGRRRIFSSETRRRMAEAQRKRWTLAKTGGE